MCILLFVVWSHVCSSNGQRQRQQQYNIYFLKKFSGKANKRERESACVCVYVRAYVTGREREFVNGCDAYTLSVLSTPTELYWLQLFDTHIHRVKSILYFVVLFACDVHCVAAACAGYIPWKCHRMWIDSTIHYS